MVVEMPPPDGVTTDLTAYAAAARAAGAPGLPAPPLPEDGGEFAEIVAELATDEPAPAPAAATLGEMVRVLADAVACAGEVLSMTVTGYTHEIWVTAPDWDAFRRWCAWLHIEESLTGEDRLVGAVAHGATHVQGWLVHVGLFGAPALALTAA